MFIYRFGSSFGAWRCFFLILLSYTSTPVSTLVSSIDIDPAAVFVPVAYFFDIFMIGSKAENNRDYTRKIDQR